MIAETTYRGFTNDAITPSSINVVRELSLYIKWNEELVNEIKNNTKGMEEFIIRVGSEPADNCWVFDIIFKNGRFITIGVVDKPFEAHYFKVDTVETGDLFARDLDFNLQNIVYIISTLQQGVNTFNEYCEEKRCNMSCSTYSGLIQCLDLLAKESLYKNNTKVFWGYAIELIRQSGQHLPMTYYTLYLRMFGDTYNGKNVSDYFIISYGNVWYNKNL